MLIVFDLYVILKKKNGKINNIKNDFKECVYDMIHINTETNPQVLE